MIKYILDSSDCLGREKFLIKKNLYPSEYLQVSLENLKLKIETLGYFPTPIGSVEFVREYLTIIGKPEPTPINYINYTYVPEESMFNHNMLNTSLLKCSCYENRNIWLTSYNSVTFFKLNRKQKLFIKPYKLKEFEPIVINIREKPSEEIQKAEKIFVSDVVDFTSEYRFYICEGEILGHSIYGEGDRQWVDSRFVEYIEADFRKYHFSYPHQTPIAYSIDVGLDKNGKHYLVELNDGWALGFYPWGTCSFESYLRVIDSRWRQLVCR